MFNSASETRRRLTRGAGVAAVAATGALALSFADFSTAQDTPPAEFAGTVSFADVIERVSPSVVTISVKSIVRPMPTSDLRRLPRGSSPLDEFFGQFFGMPGSPDFRGVPRERGALGSGFVVDEEGYIATNRHVVENADEVVVTLPSGEEVPATVVGQDQGTDLALLKIDAPEDLEALRFGDSDNARVGDWVLAIGNPFGLGGTATAGIISARGRDIQSGPYDDYLQIDAPINQGNSGGPIVNAAGEVIGVNTAIFSPNGGNVGIGFAIPANQAKSVIDELKEDGVVSRGWLGVQIQSIDEGLAEALGLDGTDGALIASVVNEGPAGMAGVMAGDVVTEFAGRPVDSPRTLARLVAEEDAGTSVDLTVLRGDDERMISVELGERNESPAVAAAGSAGGSAGQAAGLSLRDLTPAEREELGLAPDAEGALVAGVQPGSPAARQGIERGDVIVQVNQNRVDSAQDVLDELSASRSDGRRAVLLLRRGDAQRFVALDFA